MRSNTTSKASLPSAADGTWVPNYQISKEMRSTRKIPSGKLQMEQKQMHEWSFTKKVLNNCITDIITKCGAGLTITKSAKQR
jgi:hypothetical protein